MEIERYDDGIPSWVELGSPDLAKSRAFYGGLFGWDCPEGPSEAGGYSVCTLRGKNVAGLGPKMNPDLPTFWMSYVNVDSADDTVAKVTANGGSVLVAPIDVLDAGRMAIVADPVGAVLGLWQPKANRGAQVVNEAGALCWNELITTDLDASKAFYRALFGWAAVDQGPVAAPPAYTEWKLHDRSIGGMMLKHGDMPVDMPPSWGVYFGVDDADAAVAEADRLGGAVLVPPTDIEPGRFAVLVDDVGATFNVIAVRS